MNIGIFGISYCGSTLISYILGKHSDIFSVGESHWLIDKHPTGYPQINHALCTICRAICTEDCDFYTKDFIDSLTFLNLVEKIENKAKEKFNVKHILYSDKNLYNYDRLFHSNCKSMDKAIFLFKRPEGFIHSFLRHDAKNHKDRSEEQIFNRGINLYSRTYQENRAWIEERKIPVIYIFFEDFTKNPNRIIKHLCDFLEIPYEENLTSYWDSNNKFHQVGGNTSSQISIFDDYRINEIYGTDTEENNWYRKIRKNIVFDQRWKTLNPKHLDILKNHKIQKTFQYMLDRRSYDQDSL